MRNTHCRRGTRRVLVKVGTEDGAWRSQDRSYAASFHGYSTKGTGILSAEEGMQGFRSHVSFVFREPGIRIMNA